MKMTTWFAALILLLGTRSYGGTIAGQIATPTGGPIVGATLNLTLSRAAIVSGSASLAPSTVSCYTSNAGNVVGVPDPLVLPGATVNSATGTLPAGTYFVRITYVTPSRERLPSAETTINLPSGGNAPGQSPGDSAGAGHRVQRLYISTAAVSGAGQRRAGTCSRAAANAPCF